MKDCIMVPLKLFGTAGLKQWECMASFESAEMQRLHANTQELDERQLERVLNNFHDKIFISIAFFLDCIKFKRYSNRVLKWLFKSQNWAKIVFQADCS